MPELGDQPIESKFVKEMELLARGIDQIFNGDVEDRSIGFILLVFPYGEKEGRCNYISNGADRNDVATMLEEQAKRFREL